jgi:CMP-N-acetylneuraminic acid synthetase
MSFMRNIAIIPARGGSKRLPRKNILPFLGKPILFWSVEAAIESGLFERVVVSTEDDEIAEASRARGFDVLIRPEALATDASTCAEVCLHVLDHFESVGERFDVLCCLYATAPLRTARDIASTLSLLGDDENNLADFAFAMVEYSHSPYQALIPDADGFFIQAWPLVASAKSQALPAPFIGNGSTYAARVPQFRRYRDFCGPRLRGYFMPHMRSIDIDTAEDYEFALFAAEWLQQNGEMR